MANIRIDTEPISAPRGYGPVGATAWGTGDPLVYTAGLLVPAPNDGTEIIVTDQLAGFALEPSTGNRAASRPADSGTANLAAGMNQSNNRSYSQPLGLRLRFTKFWTAATPGTAEAIVAADIGLRRQISAENAATNNWGIEDTAAAAGTDVCARLIEPLSSDGLPIRLFGGTGFEWSVIIDSVA